MSTQLDSAPIQVVIGYDFSELAQLTLDRAITLAQREPRHVLHILAVLEERNAIGMHKADYVAAAETQQTLTREVEARLTMAAPKAEIHFFIHVRFGGPAPALLMLAHEVGAHLILVGSHGRTGLKRLMMGSVSEQVVREAKCPVLVVRAREYADVQLVKIVDAPADADHTYIRPHRYSYTSRMVQHNDPNWPLN